MSIILDALKKSEAERQHNGAPGLYETRIAPPRPRLPLWLVIICALLLVNAIGLAWVLLRGHSAVPTPPTAAVPVPVPVPMPVRVPVPVPIQPVMAPAAPIPQSAVADADTNADSAAAIAPDSGGAHVYRIAPERALAPGPPPPLDIPSYQDAAASGGLPPNLAINLHSWSKDPSQRYILLNMVRLKEGDTSPQGVKVETITQDGAVLSWQGQEFTLQP